ncbi:hypothetical protein [Denitromonas sp.]|uniref:hypothetical protein n=1 Tax=Denitromonas sp. TaxID=2734609 RepID=UPI003A8C5D30
MKKRSTIFAASWRELKALVRASVEVLTERCKDVRVDLEDRTQILKLSAELNRMRRRASNTPTGSSDPRYDFGADQWREIDVAEQWMAVLQTNRLRRQAVRLRIPFPADEELFRRMEWDDDEDESEYLTEQGFQVARERIRAECQYRRTVAAFWLSVVTGLIGALIGLVSVLGR